MLLGLRINYLNHTIFRSTAQLSKILKNNGTIKLGVQDVLNTQQFNGYARYANVDTRVNTSRESRRITLGFTLKFGKSNIAPSRKRSTGATEEQQRAGGGGGNS